jgi:hypothetical protein
MIHAGDDHQSLFQSDRCWPFDKPPAPGDFQKREIFLNRPARNREEVAPIGFAEPTVSFSEVGGDGERSAIELVDEKAVAAWERLGQFGDLVGKYEAPDRSSVSFLVAISVQRTTFNSGSTCCSLRTPASVTLVPVRTSVEAGYGF